MNDYDGAPRYGYGDAEQPGYAHESVTLSWRGGGMTNSPPPEGWHWDDKGRHYFHSDGQDGLTVYSAEASERVAEEQRRQGYIVPHRPGQQADWGYRGPSDYDGGRPTQSGTPQDRRPGPADAAESYEVGKIYHNSQGVPFQLLSTGEWAPVQDASIRQPAPASQRSWGEAFAVLRSDPSVSRASYKIAAWALTGLGINIADEPIPLFGQLDDVLAPGELLVGAVALAVTISRISRLRNRQ